MSRPRMKDTPAYIVLDKQGGIKLEWYEPTEGGDVALYTVAPSKSDAEGFQIPDLGEYTRKVVIVSAVV